GAHVHVRRDRQRDPAATAARRVGADRVRRRRRVPGRVVCPGGERVRGRRLQPEDRGGGTGTAADAGTAGEHVVAGDADVVGRGGPDQAHAAGRGTGDVQAGRRGRWRVVRDAGAGPAVQRAAGRYAA